MNSHIFNYVTNLTAWLFSIFFIACNINFSGELLVFVSIIAKAIKYEQ